MEGEGRAARRAAATVLACLAALAVAVIALAAGFAACALPQTTRTLSRATSLDDVSPYTRDELVVLAEATRDYTVGAHDLGELLGAEAAALASAVSDGRVGPEALGLTGDADEAAEALAGMPAEGLAALFTGVSERLVLPARALSHLDDCHAAAGRAAPALIGAAVAAPLLLAGCARLGGRRSLGGALLAGGLVALGLFAALAAWAAADFDGLFSAFHGLFFQEGTWKFPWDSLLICMYPEAFWTGMAAVWAGTSGALALACAAVGAVLLRRGRAFQRAR